MKIVMNIVEKLINYKNENDLTVDYIAKHTNYSRAYISKVMSGKRKTTVKSEEVFNQFINGKRIIESSEYERGYEDGLKAAKQELRNIKNYIDEIIGGLQ